MNAFDSVRPTLHDWGSHPVLVEISPSGEARGTRADELLAQIRDVSDLLKRHGIRRGQIVALFLDNSTDFVRLFFALLRLGAIPAPLNPVYQRMELREILDNCRPSALIAESRYRQRIQPHTDASTLLLRSPGRLDCAIQGSADAQSPELEASIASINYTYRGYGYPLGAMIPHGQYVHGAAVLQDGLQGRAEERMLLVLPLSQMFPLVGCLFVPLLFGMTIVILPSIHPRRLFETMVNHRIDYLTAVPEVLSLLARVKDEDLRLPSLKAFVCGGSALSAENYDRIRAAFGVDLMHGYGLTEFAPVSRNIRGSSRPETIGPVCRGIRLRCGAETPRGEALIQTEYMARGYLNRPRESADVFVDGWFRTGDVLDRCGDHLVFHREIKGTRKVNGSMVDLAEVRRAVVSFPKVQEADIMLDQGNLRASIEPSTPDWCAEDAIELKRFLRGRIAEYKIPKRIVPIDTHGHSSKG